MCILQQANQHEPSRKVEVVETIHCPKYRQRKYYKSLFCCKLSVLLAVYLIILKGSQLWLSHSVLLPFLM